MGRSAVWGPQGVLGAALQSHSRCCPALTLLHTCMVLCSPAHSRSSALGIICMAWPADGSITELTVEIILSIFQCTFALLLYAIIKCLA